MSEAQNNQERSARRVITGVVASDKMDQTITIRVERMFKHPKYHKYIRKHSKVYAHDANNEARVGIPWKSWSVVPCRSSSATAWSRSLSAPCCR